MVKVFKLFLILGFLISEHFAAYISATITAERLGIFAAEIELNKALIQHLEERNSSLRIPLSELRVALERFEEAFYQKELLSRFCHSPRYLSWYSDIFSAAYRKDLDNPFSVGYNLKLLALEGTGLPAFSSLADLKRLNIHDEVLEMVRTEKLHFKSDFKFGYVASVKDDVGKIIINRMRAEFSNLFFQQIGYNMQLAGISHFFIVSPECLATFGSNLTLQMAKLIFIHLPFIKFTRKERNKLVLNFI